MEFVLYFLLRRYFVKLVFDDDTVFLRKGLLFRRYSELPLGAVIRYDVRRSPLLRLLRGAKVTLYTFSGKVTFYLHRDEMQKLPQFRCYPVIKPRVSSVLAGAFVRTGALGGTVVFSATLMRAGSIFGSGYYNALSELLSDTAQGLDEFLGALRIAVPQVTSAVAVFVAAAWVFAFVRNIVRYSRFVIVPAKGAVTVRHGLVTLYESTVPLDACNAVLQRETASTLLTGAAPIFCAGTMLIPPMCSDKRRKALRLLCPDVREGFCAVPPARAFLGHVAVPLAWGGTFAALLLLTYIVDSDPVFQTVLWVGVWVALWLCILFAVYMRRSGYHEKKSILVTAARHGTALIIAYIPRETLSDIRLDSSLFQRRSGMCDLRVRIKGRIRLRLRNIRTEDISVPL